MEHQVHTAIHPPYLWKEVVHDPYLLRAEFFDYTSIELQHVYTDQFINAACSASCVQDKPGRLLSWYEKTLCLFYAGKLLYENVCNCKDDIAVDVAALPWKEQPHWLESAEILQPWKVIEACFAFMPHNQWEIELHTWLHAAFYEYSVLEEVSKSAETTRLLHRLADGMWVIYLNYKQGKVQAEKPMVPAAQDRLQGAIKDFFTAQSAV